MPSVDINWWAILLAVAVNMAVGMAWYSKSFFGKEWMKLTGRKMEDMGKDKNGSANQSYMMTTVGALVQAYVLAHFVTYAAYFYPTYSNFSVGVLTGLWSWLAFVAVPQGTNTLFEGRRKKLWAINTGYFLVVLLVNGVILASWH